jgi:large subunit ribosomal protein L4
MTLDIVDHENKKVGSVDVSDEVFGGRVNADVMWESVVHANAAARRGTHQTKNRANVSGSGKKPWRQKGTGRARVGSIRNPLWRHGGTVFGPQPRSYDYRLPKKVERAALRAALAQKLKDGDVVVVEALTAAEVKTKAAAELLRTLTVTGKAVLIDVALDENMSRSVRNIAGVSFVSSQRVTARDIIDARRVVVTKSALEKLQEALAQESATTRTVGTKYRREPKASGDRRRGLGPAAK